MQKTKHSHGYLSSKIMNIVKSAGLGKTGKEYLDKNLENSSIKKLEKALEWLKRQETIGSHEIGHLNDMLER